MTMSSERFDRRLSGKIRILYAAMIKVCIHRPESTVTNSLFSSFACYRHFTRTTVIYLLLELLEFLIKPGVVYKSGISLNYHHSIFSQREYLLLKFISQRIL